MELSTRQNALTETPLRSVVKVNGNYLKLKAGYLFPEIGRRVKAFSAANPEAALIRLGIGDVTAWAPPGPTGSQQSPNVEGQNIETPHRGCRAPGRPMAQRH